MKKIAVIVRDKNTLVLEEDACKGDYIDLTSLSNIDFSQMEALILQGKDDIYKQKLEEVEKVLSLKAQQEISKLQADFTLEKEHLNTQAEALKRESEYRHSLEIHKLTMELEKLKQNAETQVKETKQSLDAKYNLNLQDLQTKLKNLEDSVDAKVTQERLKIQQEYMKQLNDMNAELLKLKNEKNTVLLEKQLEMTEELRKKDNSFAEERLQLKNQYDELQNQYNLLQRQKASLNVKQTGEDLEVWCNHEVQSYMQNGFFNCLWEKDNKVVREEDESKGSKADYIFSIFSSSEKEELLANVCLQMKEEYPDSVNPKKNSDYY
ncbi:MAG: DUF2130 domain-containing protein, partial [Anaeroplasmataceae bacterium]|nr:DUF2130 domain-containing protein [Anaeroplasmataceae bacterium]